VEDNPENREMIVRQPKAGWRVLEAENGRRALDVMQIEQPGVILLDLMMPEMDGFEFIRERQHPQWRSLPVIVLTAKDLTLRSVSGWEQTQRVYSKGSSSRQLLLDEIHSLIQASSEPIDPLIQNDDRLPIKNIRDHGIGHGQEPSST